jgi:16S rRNA (cytosine967-C5)-methyltransferase
MLEQGRSLGDALPEDATPLLREIVFGVTRWYWRLRAAAQELMKKPLRRKDSDLEILILIGLYQLDELRTPAHAAINETVEASGDLGKGWARGLINGVLRNYQRQKGRSLSPVSDEALYCHPRWLVDHVRDSWPSCWQRILEANNERAPMVLRVNCRRLNRDEYLTKMQNQGIDGRIDELSEDGLILDKPVPVRELPGFLKGTVSVQDTAAQWAAQLLPVEPADRILDACSAPGGKLTHVLERYPQAGHVLAIDNSEKRAAMVRENLHRLELPAEFCVADAGDPDSWWNGKPFNCVLLDAPCSGSGVIRRHPDIKHLRKPDDLKAMAAVQERLLDRLWKTVAPGGHLLYVTCSIFPEENDEQLDRFLEQYPDAEARQIAAPAGQCGRHGLQTLPGVHNVDGFYYSLLQKRGSRHRT